MNIMTVMRGFVKENGFGLFAKGISLKWLKKAGFVM